MLNKMGYIIDELNLDGDVISTYMVFAIGICSIGNVLIHFYRDNQKKSN